ncbi:MAG: hypothetical protein HKN37_04865, partial [Rhodothermales bacterium]|nr:hypothetical protein [Rhodothermales bacterium]
NTDWDDESDGTLEERIYYCQNWRHDVVALIDASGGQLEQARYTAYGVPDGLPAGDADSDGDVDGSDATQVNTWISAGYDVRGDLDLDGDVDFSDYLATVAANGDTLGWGALSLDSVGNRKGYAGYEFEAALADAYRLYHVRHRVLNSDLGAWSRRDPLGPAVGMNLYGYANADPLVSVDPLGLLTYTGPTAVNLSWVAGFSVHSTLLELIELYGEVSPIRLSLMRMALGALWSSQNPTPPAQFGNRSAFDAWDGQKEHRGWDLFAAKIDCVCGRFSEVIDTDRDGHSGWTPIIVPGGVSPLIPAPMRTHKKAPGVIEEAEFLATYGCAHFRVRSRARLSLFVNLTQAVVFGQMAPWITREMEYMLCCDGALEIKFKGSYFPSHAAHVDGAKQGWRDQTNLAQFIYQGTQSGEILTPTTYFEYEDTVPWGDRNFW